MTPTLGYGCRACAEGAPRNDRGWRRGLASEGGALAHVIRNYRPIVRGSISRRLMSLLDEGRRAGGSEHTAASDRTGALAGDARRGCRDRPHLYQPPRTGA